MRLRNICELVGKPLQKAGWPEHPSDRPRGRDVEVTDLDVLWSTFNRLLCEDEQATKALAVVRQQGENQIPFRHRDHDRISNQSGVVAEGGGGERLLHIGDAG